jgi:5'-deoxynucleotidase YfbR-like HD superfamily hydrolase
LQKKNINMKIEEKDLEELKKLKDEFENLVFNLGELELMSWDVENKKKSTQNELKQFYEKEAHFRMGFEKKYGKDGRIDLEKGEIQK